MNPYVRFRGVIPALIFVLSLSSTVHAQEQLGMRFDRFAGLSGATLNPAQMAFMPHPWEIRLVEADAFVENNYGFVTNTGVLRLIRHGADITEMDENAAVQPYTSGGMQLGYYSNTRLMRGVLQTRVSGPGFALRLGKNHVVGLSSAVRAHASMYQIPEALQAEHLKARKAFDPLFISPISTGVLTWGEIGVPYSYRKCTDALTIAFGVTPKLLFGMEAAYLRSSENLRFSWTQLDSMAFSSGNWDIAMTTGNLDMMDQAGTPRQSTSGHMAPQVNGYGAGVDLGVVIALPGYDGESAEDYRWRFGISLVDFGMIRFNRHAEYHQFVFDSARFVSGINYSGQTNIDSLMAQASENFLGSIGTSMRADHFNTSLPTALVLQFDYQVATHFYVGSVLVQRIAWGKFPAKHVNTLSVMPRWEQRWLSVTAPVTLSDGQSLRVGMAARLGWLTIGTDNLNSYFRQDKFHGTDIYIGIKMNGWARSITSRNNSLNRFGLRKIRCFRF